MSNLSVTLSINDIQYYTNSHDHGAIMNILSAPFSCCYAECRYAERRSADRRGATKVEKSVQTTFAFSSVQRR